MTTWRPSRIPEIHAKEFEALRAAGGPARIRNFVSRAVSQGWVCGWGDDDVPRLWPRRILPLWPHPDYAAAGHDTGSPVFYRLDHLLHVHLPIFRFDGTRLGVFPVERSCAAVLDPPAFGALLDDSLDGVIEVEP
ncbi:MAG TPA: hypothetical protein VFT95_10155 [Micromonosporaceae bacterium]|nr:hypothetical protein [Micromonosporaceae bacterium]